MRFGGSRGPVDLDEINEPSPSERREREAARGRWSDADDAGQPDESRSKKLPLPIRIVAWCAVVIIFFGIGYWATNSIFNWMDSRVSADRPRTPENLTAGPEETKAAVERTLSADSQQTRKMETYTLNIPEGNAFTKRRIQCQASIREDVIKQTVAAYMDAVKESSMLDASVQIYNLFASGDCLYLNMNQAFLRSLNTIGVERTRYLITGLVMTVSDNFEPLNKVKFYIDGREIRDKKPVDLSQAWALR